MGLKIKSFREIMQGMVDWTIANTKRITDFSPGSAIRTLFEAIATELEQFYFVMKQNMLWAIENSIYESFGFKLEDAKEASGEITLFFSNPLPTDLIIPKGTRFSTVPKDGMPPLFFRTREDYKIKEGSVEANIIVYCETKGTIGNVSAETIKIMTTPISFVSEITNRLPFTNGKEAETISERKQRFKQYINTLARGTVESIEYGSKEVEGIAGVWVEEDIGVIRVYAHDANGDLPQALKDKLYENLLHYKPAGIPLEIYSISNVEIDLSIEVEVSEAYYNDLFKNRLLEGLTYFLNSYPVSKDFYIADIVQFVKNFDEIAVRNCKVITPTEDIKIPNHQIIRPKSITITLKQTEE